MPITKSAKKALRQSVKKRIQNVLRKEAYRNVLKEVKKAIAKGDIKAAEAKLSSLYKALDKAAKTFAIPKNRASRIKSRISRLVKK